MTRLIELHVENVKRVRAVSLTFDGPVTTLSGPNAAGKTSTVDAIWYALAGAGTHPPEVLRRGAEKGSSRLVFDTFEVERKFTPKGTTLAVTMTDGKKVARPQEFLDALCRSSGLAFDPLAFLDFDKKRQVEIVRQLAQLDFAEADKRLAELEAERTEAHRAGEDLKARVQAFAPDPAGLPEAPIDVAELLAEQGRRQAARLELERARVGLANLSANADTAAGAVASADIAILELEEQLAVARRRRLEHVEKAERCRAKVALEQDRLNALPVPNLGELTEQLGQAQHVNRALELRADRLTLEQQLTAKRGAYKKLVDEIERMRGDKREKLRAAKFPIDGLGFGLEGLTFKELPFEQASDGEKLRVGMAIGCALNPKLKLVLIRRGSLLDSKGLQLLAQIATEAGAQVIVEKVADAPDGSGFFIVDGALVDGEVQS